MPALVIETLEQFSVCLWSIQEDDSFFKQQLSYIPSASHSAVALQQFGSRMALKSLQNDFPFQRIEKKASRQPFLPDGSLQFSFSHCSGFGAAALSTTHAVGVDVEKMSNRVLKVIPRFLNANEQKFIQTLPEDEQIRYATLFWCIKESAFKARGESGVDFKQDILIQFQRTQEQLDFFVEFKNEPSTYHSVYFKTFQDLCLTALYLKN